MRATALYGPRDIRFEERETPRIVEPTDAVIRMAVTCVCGSDLWPYRGLQPTDGPTPMGHEYCGVVEEVGGAVRSVKPGRARPTTDQKVMTMKIRVTVEGRGRQRHRVQLPLAAARTPRRW